MVGKIYPVPSPLKREPQGTEKAAMKPRALPLVALAFATLFAAPAAAQAPYPSRPIKLLVPIPPTMRG